MKLQPLPLLLITAIVAAVPGHANPAGITSRYTKLTSCSEVAHGPLERGEDWVSHKCKGYGGFPIWLTFTDSVRGYVGFGQKPNVTGTFGTYRDDKWPVEWRGRQRGKRFEPIAVIIRMSWQPGGPEGNSLIIYRLRSDGTSCIVGSTEGSNVAARKIADEAIDKFACDQEPQLR